MKLKELRIKNKMTQADVAKLLNLSSTGYNYYEAGKREPNIETLIKLANIFQVTLDELVGRDLVLNPDNFSKESENLSSYFVKLNDQNKYKVLGYILGLLSSQE